MKICFYVELVTIFTDARTWAEALALGAAGQVKPRAKCAKPVHRIWPSYLEY